MGDVMLRFTKAKNGDSLLACVRADGSSVWQRNRGSYFTFHDLTHYAVETTLGLGGAFYGLLGRGWSFEDWGAPWPRGKPPGREPGFAENIVGLLQAEQSSRVEQPAAEFNYWLRKKLAEQEEEPIWELTDAQLSRIRRRVQELFAQWRDVDPGDALALPFIATQEPVASCSSDTSPSH